MKKNLFFRYNFAVLLFIWFLILLLLDPVTFITKCSCEGSSLNEILDAYNKVLGETAVNPPELTAFQTEDVVKALTDNQKANIDSHLIDKFGDKDEWDRQDPLVTNHIKLILQAYKYYFDNKR